MLIIGSKKSIESQQLKKEAEKRNHYLKIMPLNQLILGFQKNLFVSTKKGRDISEFDAILFRAISRHIVEAKIIARYMKNKNKIVIDDILAKSNYDYHKFLMHTKLKELALTAARAAEIEFAGLDIMPDKNGRLKVLEINRSPQFKRFSQVTGINVAEEVIKYIEKKR